VSEPERSETGSGDVRRYVVALGGNALVAEGDTGSIEEQDARAAAALGSVAGLAARGHEIVLTHGNGPVVGNIVLRNEAARDTITPMPLYIDDADSQGGIGFMLERVLRNEMADRGVSRDVVALVTQVLVAAGDPAFRSPSKPIGPRFSEEDAERLARNEGWFFREGSQGRFRRVVPSPAPQRILEERSIRGLLAEGAIVIACGGGGVPVVESESGRFEGVEAVIDKDRSSALLATSLDADALIILMEADAIFTDWGTERARRLRRTDVAELESLLDAGAFEAGSIVPKVEALCDFVRSTGREGLVCRADQLDLCLAGRTGTRVAASP
jgi:carbamate kinase